MPGFNGTGPRGMGPMTGGGRGYCLPRSRMPGYGFRAGSFGNRFFSGRRFYNRMDNAAPVETQSQELNILRSQAKMLRKDMADVEARIRELENTEK